MKRIILVIGIASGCLLLAANANLLKSSISNIISKQPSAETETGLPSQPKRQGKAKEPPREISSPDETAKSPGPETPETKISDRQKKEEGVSAQPQAKLGTATVAGKILRQISNKPVKGAIAKLAMSKKISARKTKEDGAYSFLDLPAGEALLGVYADNGLQSQKTAIFLTKDRAEEKNFYFSPGAAIKIKVTCSDTGLPASGVAIELSYKQNKRDMIKSLIADDSGIAEAPEIFTTGICNIKINKEGYFPLSNEIYLGGGENLYNIELALEPLIAFSGKIVDADKKPVSGAKIDIYIPKNEAPFLKYSPPINSTSNEDGSFTILGLKYTKKAKIIVSHPDYPTFEKFNLELNDRADNIFVLKKSGLDLIGSIKDLGGSPIAGAELEMRSVEPALIKQDERTQGITKAFTDAQGKYKFENVNAGEKIIFVRAAGFQPQQSAVSVPANGEKVEKDFNLAEGLKIEGDVLDENNKPIPGVSLNIYAPEHFSAKSDENGHYQFDGLPPSSVNISIDHPDYLYKSADDILPPRTGFNIVLTGKTGAGAISGRINVEGSSGLMPSIEMKIYIKTDTDMLLYSGNPRKDIDASGNFTISGLPDGRYILEAKALGYASSYSNEIYVKGPRGMGNVFLTLKKPGWIEGVVVDSKTQSPIKDVTVLAGGEFPMAEQWRSLSGDYSEQRTGETGRFAVRNLPEGPYTLNAVHPLYKAGAVAVSVVSGSGTQGIEIKLEKK